MCHECYAHILVYKRVRCYIASLEGNELPNPQVSCHLVEIMIKNGKCSVFLQSLLASVSKPTKLALGRVGMFSVASLNAIVSSYYYYRDTLLMFVFHHTFSISVGVLSNRDGDIIQ